MSWNISDSPCVLMSRLLGNCVYGLEQMIATCVEQTLIVQLVC